MLCIDYIPIIIISDGVEWSRVINYSSWRGVDWRRGRSSISAVCGPFFWSGKRDLIDIDATTMTCNGNSGACARKTFHQ